jgi:hypothetical protein
MKAIGVTKNIGVKAIPTVRGKIKIPITPVKTKKPIIDRKLSDESEPFHAWPR